MRAGRGLRALAGTAVLAGALLAVPAAAAMRTRPVCHLVKDASGDAGVPLLPGGPPVVPGSDSDDLLSADVASDGRTVTAVLRMAALQPDDPVAPTGRAYTFTFRPRGTSTTYFLAARTYLTGSIRYLYGYQAADGTDHGYNVVLGEGTGSMSTSTGTVRISAPAARLRPRPIRGGDTLLELRAGVYRWTGSELVVSDEVVGPRALPTAGYGTPFDQGQGDRYLVGTPSCVKP